MRSKIGWSLVLLSVGISIKMSAMLYLPALLLNLNYHFGLVKTALSMVFLVVMQVLIGLEWILYDWRAYVGKAFEFDRVFMFKWSVNWQFLGEEVATGKTLAKYLLMAHLGLLMVFLLMKWSPFTRGVGIWFKELRLPELLSNCKAKVLDPRFVALSMFTCNLIGIFCARSLHYQFYSWYYHTLPLILYYIRSVPLFVK
jgi:alpha-1,3-mannosyltransferase